jgi:hypothetical protein
VKYTCNFHFAAAFQWQQKSMALKGHCKTVLDIFILQQALSRNCLRNSEQFFQETLSREKDCETDPQFSVGVLQLQKTLSAKQQFSLLSFAEKH